MTSPILAAMEMDRKKGTDEFSDMESNPMLDLNKVSSMDIAGTCSWLQKVGFPDFVEMFSKQLIDGSVLVQMEEKHLIEMGIVIGRRLKFLKVLASLKSKSRYDRPLFWGFWGFGVFWSLGGVLGFLLRSRLRRELPPPDPSGRGWEIFFLDSANLIEKNTPDLKLKKSNRAVLIISMPGTWCLVPSA